MNKSKDDIVTCEYCEHHKSLYSEKEESFFEKHNGYCKIKNTERATDAEICEFFNIKAGYYTSKWYPNKENYQL
ncbi:MAG: hypothetical protein IJD45_02550 [Clostridia bacterium]|nr:hypothetical protein [Clostridia bacterium]